MCESSNIALLFQDLFDISDLFTIPHKFEDQFSIQKKKAIWILIEIEFNL